MVSRRLAWLRLLVTALLCAAGLARPSSARWDDGGAQRLREPIHVSAASVRAEVGRLDERADDTRDVGPAILGARSETGPTCCRAPGTVAIAERPPGLDRRDRPRARGPPVV